MSVSTTDLARAWEKDDVVRSNARKHQAVPRKNFDLFGGSYIMFFQNHSLRCVSTVLEYHTWATWGLETMGPFAQVKAEGNLVTRGALVTNEMVLTHAIQHVGSRVSVDVLYLHLSSLYEFMECPMQSSTVGISTFVFSTPGQPFMQNISVFFRVTLSTGIDNIYIVEAKAPWFIHKPGIFVDAWPCTMMWFGDLICQGKLQLGISWQTLG